ncbi:oxidoreductase [Mycobacteroides chelonae]|uniref:Oxidoreductase n=1 Tax=Mycobacteroides chelonae TaxID=1774 RepID=A0A1S1LK48_MYCCH|nr:MULTISPECIES: Gfo/Idh/MocA family oxidoreductase [Mycobacteroides]KRQ21033.1 oxidoreductase [Mycobacteroides sp. H003]KRQ35454.1 oxidoreductase [Mycobacteroides sp. H092]KRQ37270.1 oxidoreductase [Mycobacteroides sp. H101]KRQ43853.1 oxidoreductase [Mycobacteroides sp. H063]KRQ61246.1 oxidoreductase [Mycobacteroides sp. H079]
MPDTIRWGIIGPGRIAGNVARDFPLTPGAELIAVASRSAERARDFAETHRIPRAFGSYRELLADPDVDAVYIATPHPQHRQAAIAALTAGKAILVEKAFTATAAGAQEIIDIARARGVFAMEAMWTRFQPAIVAAKNLVDDGAIGEVRQVQADLGVDRPFDPDDRLFSPTLGGGALLDLGVYVVSLAQYFLGDPAAVVAHGSLFPTGVDAEAGLLLRYDDGRTATLLCSLLHHTPGQARIFGTEGWIDILPRFHHPREIVLHRKGSDPESIVKPPVGGGYSHELAEVTGCLLEGSAQSTVMPLADTLAVQRVLNTACEQLGVHHREDPADLD